MEAGRPWAGPDGETPVVHLAAILRAIMVAMVLLIKMEIEVEEEL